MPAALLLLLQPLLLLLLLPAAAPSPTGSPELLLQADGCPTIRFNGLFAAYELRLPLRLSAGWWGSHCRLQRIRASADAAVGRSGVSVAAGVDSPTSGSVSLLCRSYSRCNLLLLQLQSQPHSVAAALQLQVDGSDGSGGSCRSWTLPPGLEPGAALVARSCSTGWVVFQQRVDGSMSFRQNWFTYVRGFGDPRGNFWMGLENLHHSLRAGTAYLPCRLRIEVTSVSGHSYWGEWKHFFVDGASTGYMLRVSTPAAGSQIPNRAVAYHHGAKFSTYDRDQDSYKHSCSRLYGYGGWWYKGCYIFNLNGEYPNKRNPNSNVFANINFLGRRGHIGMKKTKMMFKCDPSSKTKKSGQ